MKTVRITRYGAQLEVAEFLEYLIPDEDDLPLTMWPTFCGAGDGIGDRIVPDTIDGICVSPVCLDHDCSWAISPNTYAAFQAANNRFFKNLVSFLWSRLDGWQLVRALGRCTLYYAAVSSWIGWRNFSPAGEDPWSNPIVRDRLSRLARMKFRVVEEVRN